MLGSMLGVTLSILAGHKGKRRHSCRAGRPTGRRETIPRVRQGLSERQLFGPVAHGSPPHALLGQYRSLTQIDAAVSAPAGWPYRPDGNPCFAGGCEANSPHRNGPLLPRGCALRPAHASDTLRAKAGTTPEFAVISMSDEGWRWAVGIFPATALGETAVLLDDADEKRFRDIQRSRNQ